MRLRCPMSLQVGQREHGTGDGLLRVAWCGAGRESGRDQAGV